MASPILCRSITETYLEINTVNSLGYFIVVSRETIYVADQHAHMCNINAKLNACRGESEFIRFKNTAGF